jgi:predicted dehydrogenase
MKILFLCNSNFLRNRIINTLNKNKNFNYLIASKTSRIDKKAIIFDNYIKALNSRNFDLVYITLVNSLHYKMAKKALELGLHVVVDKPLALSGKQSLALLNIAKKKKILLSEAIIFNYHKIFDYISKLTNKSKKIFRVDVVFNIPTKINKKEIKKKLDCLSDMSSYAASIHRIFFDKHIVDKKIYFEKKNYSNAIKKFHVHVKYKDNKYFNGYFAFESEYESSIKIYCGKINIKIPFQAFALKQNRYYNIEITNKNLTKKIKFKDDNFYNYLTKINSSIKKKNFNFFYECIEKDIKTKKEFNLFNE